VAIKTTLRELVKGDRVGLLEDPKWTYSRNYECQTYNSRGRGHTRGATQMLWTRPEDGSRKTTQANR